MFSRVPGRSVGHWATMATRSKGGMGADGELAASSKVFCPACGKGRVPGERARSGKANLASAQTGRSRNIRSLMFPSSPSRCRGTATNASNDTIQSFLIECPLQLSPSAKHSQSSVSLMSFYLPGHDSTCLSHLLLCGRCCAP